jgi:enoyl-CoA hydratase
MIERQDQDGITTLQLNHGKVNALDLELCTELADAFDATAHADDVRAIVITGTGSVFCAGVDLFRVIDEGAGYVARFYPALSRVLRSVVSFPKPVVAAVNGHAIAGGCLLALAGDRRIAANGKGRIGVPELLVGVPLPSIALEVLRFTMPPQHLQRVLYSGETFPLADAVTLGMLDEMVDAEMLSQRAGDAARALAALRPAAFRHTKQQLRAPMLTAAHASASADAAAVSDWSSPETHAHIREYLDRVVGRK